MSLCLVHEVRGDCIVEYALNRPETILLLGSPELGQAAFHFGLVCPWNSAQGHFFYFEADFLGILVIFDYEV